MFDGFGGSHVEFHTSSVKKKGEGNNDFIDYSIISQFPAALSPSASLKSVIVSSPLPQMNLSAPPPPVNSSSP